MNDVPLREYIDAAMGSQRRLGIACLVGLCAVVLTLQMGNSKATKVALDAATEKGNLHNDLIRKGEQKEITFITRGQVYAALSAALVVIGLLIAYYGTIGARP